MFNFPSKENQGHVFPTPIKRRPPQYGGGQPMGGGSGYPNPIPLPPNPGNDTIPYPNPIPLFPNPGNGTKPYPNPIPLPPNPGPNPIPLPPQPGPNPIPIWPQPDNGGHKWIGTTTPPVSGGLPRRMPMLSGAASTPVQNASTALGMLGQLQRRRGPFGF
jgi:hypothetical protein